jgi:hypothetical protein
MAAPETNAAAVDGVLTQEPPPPNDYMTLWHLIGCKGALGERGSWKERVAIKLALWVASALMRDVETRKMFCLAISTEMKRTAAWIAKPAPTPPPTKND